MAQISASLVKQLREQTGAGMMDCKRALLESDGDIEASVDWLRKKGLAAAAKKSGRVAADGLVGVTTSGASGALVEVNAETDFVARNENFQDFVRTVASLALETGGDVDKLNGATVAKTGRTVADELTQLIASIGENIQLRRCSVLSTKSGIVASYVHNQAAPSLGKIGVLVAIESTAEADRLTTLGKQLAMHIAAATPLFVGVDDVDNGARERERDVFTEQARASGKPDEIIAKMVEGRLRKWYEDVVLLEQVFVIDGDSRVAKVLETAGQDAGTPVKVAGFQRFVLGEGVDKSADDFASEVAKLAG